LNLPLKILHSGFFSFVTMKVLYCIALLIGWSSAEKEKGIQELFELVSSLRSEVVALRQLPATSTSSPQKLPTQELGDLQKEVSSLRSENVALRQLTQRYENEQIQLKKKISLCRDWEKLDEYKLIKRCARNDLAYVEAQVKKFGKEAVLAAKKEGRNCLNTVLYYGTTVYRTTAEYWLKKYCQYENVKRDYWRNNNINININVKQLPYSQWREVERLAKEKCAKEQAKLVEYLLDQGADANQKSYASNGIGHGDSAIYTATYNGFIPVMEMLLNHSADIEIPNERGRTPIMHINRVSKNIAALSLLIARGANINATDKDGYTALAQATQQGEIPAMKLLLNSGADTEIADNMGQTPIFHTGSSRVAKGKKGQKEKEEALSLLLGKGAKIDAEDKNGKTAYGVAMCNKEDEWGSVLLNHGANKTQDVPKPKGDQGEGEGEGRWC